MRTVGSGAVHMSFEDNGGLRQDTGTKKLLLLDEADNLYEKKISDESGKDVGDAGGKRAIVEIISKTHHPVVLIVNDYYRLTRGYGSAIKAMARIIKFERVPTDEIKNYLKDIATREGIVVEESVLNIIAAKCGGDLRSAINDLEMIAIGKKEISAEDADVLGIRDRKYEMYQYLKSILKVKDFEVARHAIEVVDEKPENILLWIDENLPVEYTRISDLAAGYDVLSKADIYLGRVWRRQYYGYWKYAYIMLSAGVAVVKEKPYTGSVEYRFPMYLIHMNRSKAYRNTYNSLLRKLRMYCHCGRRASMELFRTIKHIMERDTDFAVKMLEKLEISKDELELLVGEKSEDIWDARKVGTRKKVTKSKDSFF